MNEITIMFCGADDCLMNAGLGVDIIEKLGNIGYFDAPASKGHHLVFNGGLMKHCVNVTNRLRMISKTLEIEWPRKESVYLVGMLHDLVKTRCYRLERETERDGSPKWEYVQPGYPGHGVASVMIACELGIKLLPAEIAAITYHMGLYGVGKEYTDKEFNNALCLYAPFVIATCCADWYAARVDEEGVWKL